MGGSWGDGEGRGDVLLQSLGLIFVGGMVYLGCARLSGTHRVLRRNLQKHREPSKPKEKRRPKEFLATGTNQVWSWDITYFASPVRERFYYLYLFLDVFGRKILSFDVHLEESQEHASLLMGKACREEEADQDNLTLHSDNRGPIK